MAGKRYHLVLLLGLILLFQSCSNSTDDASFNAVVIGPADLTGFELNAVGVGFIDPPAGFSTTGPLVFRVQKSSTDPTPVANANVRIDVGSGSNVIALLLDKTGTSCYNGSSIDPTPLTPFDLTDLFSITAPDCFSVDTQTDQFGVVQFKIVGEVFFGCGASTTDIKSSANTQVTISASFDTTSMPITIKCS